MSKKERTSAVSFMGRKSQTEDWLGPAIDAFYNELCKPKWKPIKTLLSPSGCWNVCPRAIQIRQLGYNSRFSAQTRRRMDNGTGVHERWEGVFAEMGLVVMEEKYLAGADFGGTPDNLLHKPGNDDERLLVELKCLGPDTKILRSDLRWVPLLSLKAGDSVLAFDEDTPAGQSRRKWKETQVISNVAESMLATKIVLQDGTSFLASRNHRWLVETAGNFHYEWITTDEINNRFVHPSFLRLMPVWADAEGGAGEAYLAAAFDGEGSLIPATGARNYWHLTFAQGQNAMLSRVKSLLTEFGFSYREQLITTRTGNISSQINIRGGIGEVLRFLGQIRPVRLLPKFVLSIHPPTILARERVPVKSVTKVGMKTLYSLQTEAGTFIAEGFASHNSINQNGWRKLPWAGQVKGVYRGASFAPTNMAALAKAQPRHVAQWLAYDRLLLENGYDIGKGVIFYECKDNQQYGYFFVVRDDPLFAALTENAQVALEWNRKGQLIGMPFKAMSPQCKDCDARPVCFRIADGDEPLIKRVAERLKLTKKAWRKEQAKK